LPISISRKKKDEKSIGTQRNRHGSLEMGGYNPLLLSVVAAGAVSVASVVARSAQLPIAIVVVIFP